MNGLPAMEDAMRSSHDEQLSRRGFCLCCAAGAAAAGAWLTPAQVFAQARSLALVDEMRASGATAPVTVHALRRGVSALVGSGGNIAVLAGPNGKFLVDAGLAASRPKIVKALAGLGRGPVTHLVNTHWHFDHADGNAWLNGQGAVIVAHRNTRKHLGEATRVEDWNFDFPPSPAAALPTELVADSRTLNLNGETIGLTHPGPAHTDGDLIVRFGEADILHGGDIYWRSYPFIDYSTGGSIDGTIHATETMLASASASTIIIPGHGEPSSNRAQLAQYRDMLGAVRETVSALKRGGRTVAEVVAAKPTAQFDAEWGQSMVAPDNFTRLVYAGV
jgi:glyoxylase-like metal-dependent hydrolase (beta-lactamase superfamily II)